MSVSRGERGMMIVPLLSLIGIYAVVMGAIMVARFD